MHAGFGHPVEDADQRGHAVDHRDIDHLALTGALAFLIGYYLLFTSRRVGTRPEDNPVANIEDAGPDYGFFSPHSWWPIAVALSVGITVIGLAFAVWILLLGVVMLMGTLIGFVFEYYRGPFADV